MSKIDFLSKNNIANFLEVFIGDVARTLEKYDLFENDSFLSTFSWGKLAKYLIEKTIVIRNVDEAFQKAIGLACFITFVEALRRYGIGFKVEKGELESIQTSQGSYKAAEFDINYFNSNDIVKDYKLRYQRLLEIEHILDRNFTKIVKYFDDSLRLNFFSLLESQHTIFRKYIEFMGSRRYAELKKIHIRERYYTTLKNEYTEPIFNDEKGMSLEDIYIEPEFKVHVSCFDSNDERIHFELHEDDKGFIEVPYYRKSINEYIYEILNYRDSLGLLTKRPKVILILGYPGQGKSSFCKRFVFDVISGITPLSQDIYYLKCRQIRQIRLLIEEPIVAIQKKIQEDLQIQIDRKTLQESIIILDGLDEIYMKEDLKPSDVDIFCREIIREAELSSLKVIMTSRYGYVDIDRIQNEQILILQLSGFDLEKQKKWINTFRDFHPETKITEQHIERFNNDVEFGHIKELINQPILLQIIATTNEEICGNSNRAQLYENLFKALIERKWSSGKQLENLRGIEPDDLRGFIQDIAIEIYQSGYEYIQKNTLLKHESTRKFLSKLHNPNLADSLKGIMIAFYFQEVKKNPNDRNFDDNQNDYAIEFLHKSLQEFMVAEKIWQTFSTFSLRQTPNNKRYVIDDPNDVLRLAFRLFSRRILSGEIVAYLAEVISNDHIINNQELACRLAHFLPDLIEKDFLYEFILKNDFRPIDSSLNTFYGYWSTLSLLGVSDNFMLDSIKARFVFLLDCLLRRSAVLVKLSNQILAGVFLEGINLSSATLVNSDVSNAILKNVLLDGADMTSINLSGTRLINADLSRACLAEAKLSNANFENSVLDRAFLKGSLAQNSRFTDTRFHNANLESADFRNSKFENVSMRNAQMSFSNFAQANLKGADLTLAILRGANLRSTNLSSVRLVSADLTNADLSDAELTNIDLTDAKISGAKITSNIAKK